MARTVFSLVGRISMEGLGGVAKGLGEAERHAKRFSRELGKLGHDVSKAGASISKSIFALTAVTAAVGALSYKTGQYADKLLDFEQITGLTTDSIQEYEHVARDAGVSSDGFLNGITKLSNSLPEIAKGTGTAAEAMEKLGVSVFDASGQTRDMNVLFPEIIKELQKMENITDRNALAQDIFGRSLVDLAPVLGMTGEQFDNVRKQAHSMGVVMDRDAIVAADDFRTEMDQLKAQISAAGRSIATGFIPILKDTVVPLIQNEVVPMMQVFVGKIKHLSEWFKDLSPEMQKTIVKVSAFLILLGPAVLVLGKFISGLGGLVTAILDTKAAFMRLGAFLLTNPLGLAITAVGALTLAFIELKKAQNNLKTAERLNAETEAINKEMRELQALKTEYEGIIQVQQALKAKGAGLFSPDQLWAAEEGLKAVKQVIIDTNREIQGLPPLPIAEVDTAPASTAVKKLTKEQLDALQKMKDARDKINADYVAQINQLTLTKKELLDLEEQAEISSAKKVGADVEQIEQVYSLKREQLDDDRRKRIQEKEELHRVQKEDLEKQWTTAVLYQSENRTAIIQHEYKEALALAEKYGIDKTNVEKFYSKARQDLAKEEALKVQQSQVSGIRKWLSEIGNLLSGIGSLFSQHHGNRMQEIDNLLAAQLKANEQSALSDEDKEARRQQLMDAAEEKRKTIQRKQAVSAKVFGVFQSIIDTASAVVSGLAQGGPLLASAYGLLGAFQTGLIMSQPLPSLDVGGVLTQDMKIQAHANEAIVPLEDGVLAAIGRGIAGASKGNNNVAGGEVHHHYHLHTATADEKMLKDFVRKTEKYRVSENQRTGRI